ncbi:MAG: hypothetical protein ACI4QS_08370 [Comamonas sp.]
MSTVHKIIARIKACCHWRTTMATEPPPSQPDKAPSEKDQNNDQQQQYAPRKRTPLSQLQMEY